MSSETATGADVFVRTLEQYGVTYLFGNPGTTELPIMDALSKSDIEYILALHEDIAVGMAAGYASTRRYHSHEDSAINPVGVVNLHATPGLAHGLSNVFGASFSDAPIVVTAGNHGTGFQYEEPILSGDLERMVDQFTKWSAEVKQVKALPGMLRRAFRVARTPPTGPVFLGLPMDVMTDETDVTPERLGAIPSAGRGDRNEIKRAAEHLKRTNEPPVFILGDQIARSGTQAIEATVDLAEACGARVHGEIMTAEANFPTAHEQWVSFVPSHEEGAAEVMDAELLVFIGCSTHTTEIEYDESLISAETTCIHINESQREIGKNYPADVAILGDPYQVINELGDAIDGTLATHVRKERLEAVRKSKANVARQVEHRLREKHGENVSKHQLIDGIKRVRPDALLVCEAVTTMQAVQELWPMKSEGLLANKSGGLGYGLPAALGAAIAMEQGSGERDVICVIGDGSYMYYPHTLYTAARHDLDLTVVVSNNENYNILKRNTVAVLGGDQSNYEFVGMDFEPPFDIPLNAESVGVSSTTVASVEELDERVENAVTNEGPVVLDVSVDD